MPDLRDAILDAKYIDMISLADFVVRDCGLPDTDAEGNYMPQATEIAASLFRWAAGIEAVPLRSPAARGEDATAALDRADAADDAADLREYDEYGDPLMDAEEAARLEAERGTKAEGHA